MVARFARVVEAAGYGLVVSPTFEDVEVFQRVGESTDVVRKQMYDFEDKGGRRIALRPEGTASIVRAFVQHRPSVPWKTWYVAPSFRYERPQAGRYRQHHQLGVEAIGTADPDLDVEVVTLGWSFYAALGLSRVGLLLNSLGDDVCRPGYREVLRQYLDARRGELCDEHKIRLDDNPLRVLDCKSPECVVVTAAAPRQLDHLCEPCRQHFDRVKAGLDAARVPYTIDGRLVRGLDYYTRTTFEYIGSALASAQNAIGGGGRYDGLVQELGGPPTAAIGLAIGVERTLLACDAEEVLTVADTAAPLDVFVVDFAGGEAARDLSIELRAAGISADRAFDNRSARAQFTAANRSGARVAVIVGPDEAASGTAGVKDLRAGEGAVQDSVPRSGVVAAVRRRLDTGR
jgi:histidyl-tRNA synthetase